MTAQILVVFQIRRFFMIFSEIFTKKLDVKKFQNFEDLNLVSLIFEISEFKFWNFKFAKSKFLSLRIRFSLGSNSPQPKFKTSLAL